MCDELELTGKETLKACPFCGGEAEVDSDYYDGEFAYVECQRCFATAGGEDHSRGAAIRAWNRRADEERIKALEARVAEMERQLHLPCNCKRCDPLSPEFFYEEENNE